MGQRLQYLVECRTSALAARQSNSAERRLPSDLVLACNFLRFLKRPPEDVQLADRENRETTQAPARLGNGYACLPETVRR